MLKKRTLLQIPQAERITFKNCLRIRAKKEAAMECNNLQLRNLNKPIARIVAENSGKKAFSASDDMANRLSNILYLSLGCRVMLRQNLNVSLGLVNGSLGTVIDLIYKENKGPPQVPLFVIVKFDGFDGFESIDGNVPITVFQCIWYSNGKRCSRAQIPLSLSWACTIHKSESLTLPKCEADLGKDEFQIGLTYVALSRVKNSQDLILLHNITLDRLNCIRKPRQFKLRQEFLKWLQSLTK